MALTEDLLTRLQADALSGELANASAEALERYAAILCYSQAFTFFGDRQFPQICETVRVQLLRAHIGELQKHITSLDAKNTTLSWLVVVLTVASLLGSTAQLWFAYKADVRADSVVTPHVAAQRQQPIQAASAPSAAMAARKGITTK